MTVVALALGLIVGTLVAPGSGFSGTPDDAARASAEEEIGEAGEQGIVSFFTDNVLPGSYVQPFVDNEILRILLLGILTAAAISFLADAERKKVVGVFEVAGRIIFGVIRIGSRPTRPPRSARSAAWPTPSPCSARRRSAASAS